METVEEQLETVNEKWMRWEPTKGLIHSHYYIKSISDDLDKFKIILINNNNENNIIQVLFDAPIEAYRYTDESYRLETMDELSYTYGGAFYCGWSFFKIENSSYIQWLRKEACGKADEQHFIHFCIVTDQIFFDIVSACEPKVTFVKVTGKII